MADLRDACAGVGLEMVSPATTEGAVFASVGASDQNDGWSFAGGGGAELTFGGRLWHGFPSGPYGKRLNLTELRAGPWIAVFARGGGAVVEGGPKVHLGALYHASWGTFDLRPAFGAGTFQHELSPHVGITVAWGARSEPGRYSDGGGCVGGPDGLYDVTPTPRPAPLALASVIRVFGTYRRAIDLPAWEIVLGVEVSPTFALPPYSWSRLIGFRPE